MYSTTITINGKVIPIKFGAYVLKLLGDDGIRLEELGEAMQSNPADIMPKIILYGAINASPNRMGEGLDLNLIYDWLDEVEGGLFGKEASKVLELFTNQMTEGVPKNVGAGKKTPQKKK